MRRSAWSVHGTACVAMTSGVRASGRSKVEGRTTKTRTFISVNAWNVFESTLGPDGRPRDNEIGGASAAHLVSPSKLLLVEVTLVPLHGVLPLVGDRILREARAHRP